MIRRANVKARATAGESLLSATEFCLAIETSVGYFDLPVFSARLGGIKQMDIKIAVRPAMMVNALNFNPLEFEGINLVEFALVEL